MNDKNATKQIQDKNKLKGEFNYFLKAQQL